MKTVLILEDEIVIRASEITGVKNKTTLVNMGLEALIEKMSRKRLIALGGSEKNLKIIPRRRV